MCGTAETNGEVIRDSLGCGLGGTSLTSRKFHWPYIYLFIQSTYFFLVHIFGMEEAHDVLSVNTMNNSSIERFSQPTNRYLMSNLEESLRAIFLDGPSSCKNMPKNGEGFNPVAWILYSCITKALQKLWTRRRWTFAPLKMTRSHQGIVMTVNPMANKERKKGEGEKKKNHQTLSLSQGKNPKKKGYVPIAYQSAPRLTSKVIWNQDLH